MKLVGVALMFCAITDLRSGNRSYLSPFNRQCCAFQDPVIPVPFNVVNKTTAELFCDQSDFCVHVFVLYLL